MLVTVYKKCSDYQKTTSFIKDPNYMSVFYNLSYGSNEIFELTLGFSIDGDDVFYITKVSNKNDAEKLANDIMQRFKENKDIEFVCND